MKCYKLKSEHVEYEIIDSELSKDAKKILFKSNKFSTFALVYNEVEEEIPTEEPEFPITGDIEEKKEENIISPITGDNAGIWFSVCGITFIGLIYVHRKKKNRKFFNIM